jgi:hypothetical protein
MHHPSLEKPWAHAPASGRLVASRRSKAPGAPSASPTAVIWKQYRSATAKLYSEGGIMLDRRGRPLY